MTEAQPTAEEPFVNLFAQDKYRQAFCNCALNGTTQIMPCLRTRNFPEQNRRKMEVHRTLKYIIGTKDDKVLIEAQDKDHAFAKYFYDIIGKPVPTYPSLLHILTLALNERSKTWSDDLK